MNSKLLKSILSLAVVVVFGSGATYAALTSNTVTISSSHVTTGDPHIKLCNASGASDWRTTIGPSMTASGLVPGGDEKELTADSLLYIGNDSGDLNNNDLGEATCASYGEAEGESDIPLKLLPKVDVTSCDANVNEEDFELKFKVGEQETGYSTLTGWTNNTTVYLEPTFEPDDIKQVQVFAKLDSDVEHTDESCEFDITFEGESL